MSPAKKADRYVALLRGINVGGKNLVAMPALAETFREAGFTDVKTYIQSGNVLFSSDGATRPKLEATVERMLEGRFVIPITVIVRSRDELAATIESAPEGHGSPDLRSDVYFLKAPLTAEQAHAELPELRDGVDSVALGPGALYFSRVKVRATETNINRFMGKPVFRQITVRNWRTTTRLLELLDADD